MRATITVQGGNMSNDTGPLPEEVHNQNNLVALIVDDEFLIRKLFRALIGQRIIHSGNQSWIIAEVLQAGNVPEAREVLNAMPRYPDLVLCDRSMKTEETGEVLIEELANSASPPKVIFLSGDHSSLIQEFKIRMSKSYPNFQMEVLSKPVAPAHLREAIDHLIIGSNFS